jgi:hypothetical protein
MSERTAVELLVVLDTAALVEPSRLYETSGYARIAPFNAVAVRCG